MLERPNEAGEYRCIDGTYFKEVAAFCRCGLHRGYLTNQLIRRHDCLNKGCIHFQKLSKWRPYADSVWDTYRNRPKVKRNKLGVRTRREQDALQYEAVFLQAQKHIAQVPGARLLSVHIRGDEIEFVCAAHSETDFSGFIADMRKKLVQRVLVTLI